MGLTLVARRLEKWLVDDDGDIDVLATHMYADKLVWYDNNGEPLPTFTERIIANLVCPPPFTLCFAPRNIR